MEVQPDRPLPQVQPLLHCYSRRCRSLPASEFPFQKLHQKPQLNVPPTLANATAAGYIDEWRPHGINHLMVGDLGSEEILLVATDSGNIAAYHTRAIEEAIKKDPYKFSDKGRCRRCWLESLLLAVGTRVSLGPCHPSSGTYDCCLREQAAPRRLSGSVC